MIEKNVIGNIFSKRMSELFDMRVENDKDVLEGLTELSEYLDCNTPESRRNLKSLIEKQTIQINSDFLNSFKNMKTSFDGIGQNIHKMNSALIEMKNTLSATKYNTKALIEKTMTIQKKIKNVSVKNEIVSAVLEKFQLNATELAALRANEVTPEIFLVLDKGDQISKDCRLLLQTGSQNMAQDVLEQMIIYQDAGMEKLFRWIRGKCSSLEPTILSFLMPQAMSRLQKKVNLFEQILEELSANRSIILVRQFIDALTLGGRPIEHRVTEPRRYVGDMLAWLHQSLPSEIEYLNFLLRNCDNSDELVQKILGKITEGICHPLRVRIEHVLLGEDSSQDCILIQDINILLKDYKNIISQMIHSSRLNSTFMELGEIAEKTLLLSLQNKVSSFLSSNQEPISASLFPAQTTEKVLSLLVQLLSTETASQAKEAYVLQIVSRALDPLLNKITEIASKLPAVEMAIYLLNNFYYIETSLVLYPFLDDRLERLKAQCDAQIDTLTSEQAGVLVAHLNLGPVYTLLQGNPNKPLCNNPAMDSSKLSIISIKLEKLLASPNLYQLPQVALLSSSTHKMAVQKRSFAVIVSIYSNLYEAVHNPENCYKNPNEILPISPESVTNSLSNAF